jgi:formate dehydrogenase major subunit
MELYISDHPLDCLTCSANNDCELQDTAAEVGLRDVRYGYDGREPSGRGNRQLEPLFRFRSQQMHRLFALRARLRRGAGHWR